jgi:predicted permease
MFVDIEQVIRLDEKRGIVQVDAEQLVKDVQNFYYQDVYLTRRFSQASQIDIGLQNILSNYVKVYISSIFNKQIYSIMHSDCVILGEGSSEDVLFDYMIFTLPLCLYVYSYGTASLKPDNESKFSIKMFMNPICLAMLFGAIAGLVGLPIPKFLITAISSAGACMSPLAMMLTGFVVANFSIKRLAKVKRIYLASALRLIILPLLFVFVLKLLKTDSSVIMLTLCATAMPLGLNTVVFPAAYGGDTTPGASMALISHLMSIITIPVMFMLFI